MRQRILSRGGGRIRVGAWGALVGLVVCLALTGGCKRGGATAASAPASRPDNSEHFVTVVSLVPSATDVLLSSGLGKHLLAVSTYCRDNPAAKDLPSAGDYENTDWERISALKPDVLLVYMARDRVPAGMRDRAAAQGIRIVNLVGQNATDILLSVSLLGEILHEKEAAEGARKRIENRLEAVRERTAKSPVVPTLLVLGDDGKALVGPGGFLDEMLTTAGGSNAAAGLGSQYPVVDEEKLASMKFEKVIVLMPGGTEKMASAAMDGWKRRLGEKEAEKRVAILRGWYVLLPGAHIADVAEEMAGVLHPSGATSRANGVDGTK